MGRPGIAAKFFETLSKSGISTGQDVILRFCVKPTSSILTSRKTIDINFKEKNITTKGRHDPCVGIRAVPVGEAMMATRIADHCMRLMRILKILYCL